LSVEVSGDYLCGGNSAYLTGGTNIEVVEGIKTISEFKAHCAPGMSIWINFYPQVSKSVHISELEVMLVFRHCIAGEYYSNGECIICASGSYSLKNNSDLSITSCNECPSEATESYGNTITVDVGYWRLTEEADTILTCPYSSGCIGGNATGL
jgi:hypothetical protein